MDGDTCEIVRNISLPLYSKSKKRKSEWHDIYGVPLERHEFGDVNSFMEFKKKNRDVWGQQRIEHSFLQHYYGDIDQNQKKRLRVAAIDIETKAEGGFPDINSANQEVTAITLGNLQTGELICVSTLDFECPEGVTYYQEEDEGKLLKRFLALWKKLNPHVVTGWNIEGFDIPYLINRITAVLGARYAHSLSPFYQAFVETKQPTADLIARNHITQDKVIYDIRGVICYDYLELYKKYTYTRLDSYSLNNVSHVELGEKKIDYEEYKNLDNLYARNPQKFLEYNIQDVRLILKLEHKLKFIDLAMTMAYMGKIRLPDIYSIICFWDCYISNELGKRKVIIPPEKHQETDGILGAFVKETKPDLYKWVVSFDVTSLYPSIIMQYNMSPETIYSGATGNYITTIMNRTMSESYVEDIEHAFIANGSKFRKDKLGIFPELVAHMFDRRKVTKKEMLALKQELAHVFDAAKDDFASALNGIQMALKIALNSLYGAMANPHFRYFNPDIAEGITMTGQCVIRYISEQINVFLNKELGTKKVEYVIANDTDSAYVELKRVVERSGLMDTTEIVDMLDKYCSEVLEALLSQKFDELAEYTNAKQNKLFMKREVIADNALWRAKKNYVMRVYDSEGVRYEKPKLKATGVEIVKSTTPEFIRNELKKCFDVIFDGTEQDMIAEQRRFRKEYMKMPLDVIAQSKKISKAAGWQKRDGTFVNGTPMHARAACVYNSMLIKKGLQKKYEFIQDGDNIHILFLKLPNIAQSNVIAYKDFLYDELELSEHIDRETQYEKSFLSPLQSFTDILKWDIINENRLDAFVGDDVQESNTRTFTPIAKKKETCYNTSRKEKVRSVASSPSKTPKPKKKKTRIIVEELF